MKKLITLLFILFSVNLFAEKNISFDLMDLCPMSIKDLAYDVKLPNIKVNDFSVRYSDKIKIPVNPITILSEDSMIGSDKMKNNFYLIDFAEDPFDGLIEVYAVGQPLPPTTITLMIALLIGSLLFYNRKKQLV